MLNHREYPGARLFALLAASAGVYLYLLGFDAVNGLRPVLTFLCAMLVLFCLYAAAAWVVRNSSRSLWKEVAIGAVLFRIILLAAGLPAHSGPADKFALLRQDIGGRDVAFERFQLFDNDIWRYLWDSHVSAAGLNPYVLAAADASLDGLAEHSPWSDIRDNVSYPAVPTIYPPLAQWAFRFSHWLAPGSVLVMKALLTLFDLAAAGFVALSLRAAGGDPAWAILYAWNPLVIKVFAGSGHVDAIAVACLAATAYCLARAFPAVAAACLGLAILAKISPLILIPFFWRRVGWRITLLVPAVVLAGYLPFLGAGSRVFGGLAAFGREWQFNAGPYAFLHWVAGHFIAYPAVAAKLVCAMVFAAILAGIWRRPPSSTLANEAAPALGWVVLLSPAVMPWYTTWALPFAVISGQRIWLVWTFAVSMAFFVMVDGVERPLVLAVEYGSLALVWFANQWLTARRKHERSNMVNSFNIVPGAHVRAR